MRTVRCALSLIALGFAPAAAHAVAATPGTVVIADPGAGNGPGPRAIVITDPPGPGEGPKVVAAFAAPPRIGLYPPDPPVIKG